MKLEDIGFYTLSDARAKSSGSYSPMYRAELLLTNACNFRCPYCQGVQENLRGTIPLKSAQQMLSYLVDEGLKNVRFSGDEPLLYPNLGELVTYCKSHSVERIAISTNGSALLEKYLELIEFGVNDFSISLDSSCCSVGTKLCGAVPGAWDRVVDNIREISKLAYVTVGMVFTEENVNTATKDITFADSLGVADIRIISSAQYNQAIQNLQLLPNNYLLVTRFFGIE